jgi:hypothetical protein
MEQTAVEILFKIWLKKEHITPNEWSEALEMEKQQIIDFGEKMQLVRDVDFDGNIEFIFNPEQYYNQTFKQQEL